VRIDYLTLPSEFRIFAEALRQNGRGLPARVTDGRTSVQATTIEHALTGEVIVFSGELSSVGRADALDAVTRLGGRTDPDVSEATTILVLGGSASDADALEVRAGTMQRAERINTSGAGRIRIIGEEDFCRLAGLLSAARLRRQFYAVRDIRGMYPAIREDHLRYLEKLDLVQPVARVGGDRFYGFADLAAIRQVATALDQGQRLRQVLRGLEAERRGQLAFDFAERPPSGARPARVVALDRSRGAAMSAGSARPLSSSADAPARLAAQYFHEGASLDADESQRDEAADAYRKALVLDPELVPALVNLANIHYASDRLIEAQALYERAIHVEPDCFEAYFNLANVHHDLGRYGEALGCYEEAVTLNPGYADAHFYLAVTLEKLGRSREARPHWRAYQQLAPEGEWVELAKEFSD